MSAVATIPTPIAAGSTAQYTCKLTDVNGVPVPGSALTSLVLSLFDTMRGVIVNSIKDVNILNTGRGTIDEQGNITVIFGPDDTALIGLPAPGMKQYRSAVVDWEYNSGPLVSVGRHQMNFTILALAEEP